MTRQTKDGGYVWPQRVYFFIALIGTPILATLLVTAEWDDFSIYTQSMVLGAALSFVGMFYLGTIRFCISRDGITQYVFGVKIRHIVWSDIDQVGTGYTGSGAAIVITLKGYKRYVPLKDSGRVRDAEWFSMLNHKGCILIEKASMARSLVEKFYGELDYEWNPPNYD
jgi:hypothetical protein